VIHFVVGTRAQLFKLAPIMLECRDRDLSWRWVYTAQHRETIAGTVEMFGLPAPDMVLVDWETEAKSVGRMARWFATMLFALPRARRVLAGATGRDHVVVTHGDTFTTWLGALLGTLTRTKVMHVESGLRSFRLFQPFPEELNRLITFRLASYLACPNEVAVMNVERYRGEAFDTGGNTQIDMLRFGLSHVDDAEVDVPAVPFVVATIHRYENVYNQDRFAQIVSILERAARDRVVLFVRHPVTDTRLQKHVFRERLEANPRIRLLPRLPYLSFLRLVTEADFVVSDGGGNQEELAYLGVPTLIMREATERPEGLGANAVLAGSDDRAVDAFLMDPLRYRRPANLPGGSPAATIVDFLVARGFGAAEGSSGGQPEQIARRSRPRSASSER
jgi:UDP-N-acetylglucosamine 2-epimerase (non-hydrolysing)